MVPIKEVISSGSWLQCEHNFVENYKFRLRVISFEKLNLSLVDDPAEIEGIDSNSIIWKMDIEVIALNKEPIPVRYGPNDLLLVDQDGFKFPVFIERHLHMASEFSRNSGLHRFYVAELLPKIKAVGSITFQLPDDDDAEYFISIKNDGIVQEV
jgi:hypothetical protein